MSFWRNVWRIARMNMKRVGLAHIWTIMLLLSLMVLLVSLPLYLDAAGESKGTWGTNYAQDVIFLTVLAFFGFPLSKEYVGPYWRQRTISKGLLVLRNLPISVREIVTARLVHILLLHLPMWALFFAGFYFLSADVGLSSWEYVGFAIFWLGYGLAVASLYLYWELALRELAYFRWNLVIALLLMVLPLLTRLIGFQPVLGSIALVSRFGLLWPLVALGIGVLSLWICQRRSEKRLAERDLA